MSEIPALPDPADGPLPPEIAGKIQARDYGLSFEAWRCRYCESPVVAISKAGWLSAMWAHFGESSSCWRKAKSSWEAALEATGKRL